MSSSDSIETTAATIDQAIGQALAQLGAEHDDVTIEVLSTPRSGVLGLGARPARVRVTRRAPQGARSGVMSPPPAPPLRPTPPEMRQPETPPPARGESETDAPRRAGAELSSRPLGAPSDNEQREAAAEAPRELREQAPPRRPEPSDPPSQARSDPPRQQRADLDTPRPERSELPRQRPRGHSRTSTDATAPDDRRAPSRTAPGGPARQPRSAPPGNDRGGEARGNERREQGEPPPQERSDRPHQDRSEVQVPARNDTPRQERSEVPARERVETSHDERDTRDRRDDGRAEATPRRGRGRAAGPATAASGNARAGRGPAEAQPQRTAPPQGHEQEPDEYRDPFAAVDEPGNDPRQIADLQAQAREATIFLERILALMGEQATIERAESDDPETLELNIKGDGSGILIGRHGQTLDAIEYMVNRLLARKIKDAAPISIDTESYRARRRRLLQRMALSKGEQAKREHMVVMVDPMLPRDRRIVHLALKDDPMIATRSTGDGFMRPIEIVPVVERHHPNERGNENRGRGRTRDVDPDRAPIGEQGGFKHGQKRIV